MIIPRRTPPLFFENCDRLRQPFAILRCLITTDSHSIEFYFMECNKATALINTDSQSIEFYLCNVIQQHSWLLLTDTVLSSTLCNTAAAFITTDRTVHCTWMSLKDWFRDIAPAMAECSVPARLLSVSYSLEGSVGLVWCFSLAGHLSKLKSWTSW